MGWVVDGVECGVGGEGVSWMGGECYWVNGEWDRW